MKISAKKSLGQNFLINRGVLDKVVSAAEITKEDVVLEIGSGTGNLTEKLAEKASRVIAVEKDRRLIASLKEKFSARGGPASGWKNTEVIEGDILKLDIKTLLSTSKRRPSGSTDIWYKVVGNIPYYITSHLLRKIFEDWPRPELIVLMVQKEVAQRIMAKPPHMNPERGREGPQRASASYGMNLLALSVQFYAKPKIISYVSKGSFRPIPKVDSAIIRLVPKHEIWNMDYGIRDKFFKLVKTAFAGKRKQLKNTVGLEVLNKAGIKPESRPEELSLEDWVRLSSEK